MQVAFGVKSYLYVMNIKDDTLVSLHVALFTPGGVWNESFTSYRVHLVCHMSPVLGSGQYWSCCGTLWHISREMTSQIPIIYMTIIKRSTTIMVNTRNHRVNMFTSWLRVWQEKFHQITITGNIADAARCIWRSRKRKQKIQKQTSFCYKGNFAYHPISNIYIYIYVVHPKDYACFVVFW